MKLHKQIIDCWIYPSDTKEMLTSAGDRNDVWERCN